MYIQTTRDLTGPRTELLCYYNLASPGEEDFLQNWMAHNTLPLLDIEKTIQLPEESRSVLPFIWLYCQVPFCHWESVLTTLTSVGVSAGEHLSYGRAPSRDRAKSKLGYIVTFVPRLGVTVPTSRTTLTHRFCKCSLWCRPLALATRGCRDCVREHVLGRKDTKTKQWPRWVFSNTSSFKKQTQQQEKTKEDVKILVLRGVVSPPADGLPSFPAASHNQS